MSYSFDTPCRDCKKFETCADSVIIGGAIQAIHSAPRGMCEDSWHQGSGTIRLDCQNFEKKEES